MELEVYILKRMPEVAIAESERELSKKQIVVVLRPLSSP